MKSERKAGVILSYIYTACNVLVNFIYIPHLLMNVGEAEYGLYQLMSSVLIYISLMEGGLATATTRYYTKAIVSKNQIEKDKVVCSSFFMFSIVSIVVLIVTFILMQNVSLLFSKSITETNIENAKFILFIQSLGLVVILISNVFNSVIVSYERFKFLRFYLIFQLITQSLIILFFTKLFPSANTIIIINLIFIIVSATAKYIYCKFKLNFYIEKFILDKNILKKLLRLSSTVMLVSIGDAIFRSCDKLILGAFVGTASVTIYSLATSITSSYQTLSTAISSVYLPKITKMIDSQCSCSELSNHFIKIGRLQFFVLLPIIIGFILFGMKFIDLWLGEGYTEVFYITLVIMIPFTVDLIQNTGITILQTTNQYSIRAKVIFFSSIVNIFFSIPLCIRFGGIGGAFITGLSSFICDGIIMGYVYNKKHINMKRFWYNIGNVLIYNFPIFLMFFIINLFFEQTMIFYLLEISIFIITYTIFNIIFVMNKDEKKIINSMLIVVMRRFNKG